MKIVTVYKNYRSATAPLVYINHSHVSVLQVSNDFLLFQKESETRETSTKQDSTFVEDESFTETTGKEENKDINSSAVSTQDTEQSVPVERKLLAVESAIGLSGNLHDVSTTSASETQNTSTVSAANESVRYCFNFMHFHANLKKKTSIESIVHEVEIQ